MNKAEMRAKIVFIVSSLKEIMEVNETLSKKDLETKSDLFSDVMTEFNSKAESGDKQAQLIIFFMTCLMDGIMQKKLNDAIGSALSSIFGGKQKTEDKKK